MVVANRHQNKIKKTKISKADYTVLGYIFSNISEGKAFLLQGVTEKLKGIMRKGITRQALQ